ncbi:nucleotide exchange factor GrpE [Spiroplasma tabanidicola]|uniref:Protein GrpE n=1 Tax=Spiroplasma tabanidicola TaxID=324079 RepID=A0A6I6CCD5_9MOLU|nr:nucleotide exchange factor GrpE [Spiroplasma tabanidicola]QGS51782.1 molecular chaperone GrpE (heat shock protein) [Spiroplasma tabanidicola]
MEKEKYKKVFDLINNVKKELNIDSNLNNNIPKQQTDNNNVDLNDKTNIKHEKDSKSDSKQSEEKPLTSIELLELEFVDLLETNSKLEEQKLMAVADNQNTVRRYQNEAASVRKYGGEKLATELLPAIDMFRSVLKTSPDNPEIKNYLIGFEMIINQIDQALSNAGLSMIQTKIGDELDPNIHNAIDQIETKDVKSGRIAAIVSNGYRLHDRVIKHVGVKVAK